MGDEEPDCLHEIRGRLLPVLERYGFQVRLLRHDPVSFGNCLVELVSPEFILTLTRDRGQIFVDVASAVRPTQKYPLGELIAFLDGDPDPRPLTDLESAVAVLGSSHQRLLTPELLLGRSAELAEHRRRFNERRWGLDTNKEPDAG